MGDAPRPWWHPDRHADRRPALQLRQRIVHGIRGWFQDQGFIEVEPGALQVSPGNETHLHAFETRFQGNDPAERPLYLHTSPEFACKKLLAAGEERIFSLQKVFRNRELGPLHAPEFTMLEWYRAGAPYEQVMEDAVAIVRLAAEVAGTHILQWGDTACRVDLPARVTRVSEAFASRGYDLLATLSGSDGDADALQRQATGIDPGLSRFQGWSDLFSAILVEIEPGLGSDALELLTEYPARESALARPTPLDPRVAERFEVFAAGIELANGFGELTDADLQRDRLDAQMEARAAIYGSRYPVDDDFIAALRLMPPASGCALGLDRLVMLSSGARSVHDVIWTPFPA